MNVDNKVIGSISEYIDFNEDELFEIFPDILKTLLWDHSTKKNILWMTDNYISLGKEYCPQNEITIDLITKEKKGVIKPRINKTAEEQLKRSRDKAEVFTPSWICNKQNNLIDSQWFKRESVFNREENKAWITNNRRIGFSKTGKTWEDYVLSNRLEISCGEAPYLVSRYDTTTGDFIDVRNRIGMLDRKLRIVNENTTTEEEWINWAKKAFQSIYGFEWQGDNLLLARENCILTFVDYYKNRFNGKNPSLDLILEIADIVSWNLWQMDGIKFVVPESCYDAVEQQEDLFGDITETIKSCDGCISGNIQKHNGIQCLIRDWKEDTIVTALSLLKGDEQ